MMTKMAFARCSWGIHSSPAPGTSPDYSPTDSSPKLTLEGQVRLIQVRLGQHKLGQVYSIFHFFFWRIVRGRIVLPPPGKSVTYLYTFIRNIFLLNIYIFIHIRRKISDADFSTRAAKFAMPSPEFIHSCDGTFLVACLSSPTNSRHHGGP